MCACVVNVTVPAAPDAALSSRVCVCVCMCRKRASTCGDRRGPVSPVLSFGGGGEVARGLAELALADERGEAQRQRGHTHTHTQGRAERVLYIRQIDRGMIPDERGEAERAQALVRRGLRGR